MFIESPLKGRYWDTAVDKQDMECATWDQKKILLVCLFGQGRSQLT